MDWQALGAQAILALVPVVTMLLTWGVRKVVPKLPRFTVPIIAMALGFVVTLVVNAAGGPAVTPLVGALLGAAATWLREVISTLNEHGTQA